MMCGCYTARQLSCPGASGGHFTSVPILGALTVLKYLRVAPLHGTV